jgi:hypothetical protein
MSQRLKLGAKSEIKNMCVMFWCLTAEAPLGLALRELSVVGTFSSSAGDCTYTD